MSNPTLFLWILLLIGTCATNNSEVIHVELQHEAQLSSECESQLQLKIVEGKLKDDLIFSKDIHIKDLQNIISELQDTNHILKQIVKSYYSEKVDLEKLMKEELKITQDAIGKHEERIQQNEQSISKLKEEIKSCECEVKPSGCTSYGNSNGVMT